MRHAYLVTFGIMTEESDGPAPYKYDEVLAEDDKEAIVEAWKMALILEVIENNKIETSGQDKLYRHILVIYIQDKITRHPAYGTNLP